MICRHPPGVLEPVWIPIFGNWHRLSAFVAMLLARAGHVLRAAEAHVSGEDCGTLISDRPFGRYAGLLGKNSRVNGIRPEKVPFRDATLPLQGQAPNATVSARGTEMSKAAPDEKNFGSSI
jgi:hypothetical protein